MSKRKNKKRNRQETRKKTVRVQDSFSSPSGAGSRADRGRGYEPMGMRAGSEHVRGSYYYGLNNDGFFYRLWRDYWEAAKIVDIPPYDMTREGWSYEGQDVSPDDIKKIEEEANRIKLLPTVRKALHYERLYGGSVILLGTKEARVEDKRNAASKPLLLQGLETGDLAFIRALPRYLVTPTSIETDPLSERFQMPKRYMIFSHEVHRSRLLVFDGGGDPGEYLQMGHGGYSYLGRRDGFGFSVLQKLFNDIIRSDGSRQAAFHLMHLLSILLFKKEGGKGLKINKTGAERINELEDILDSISIYKGAILDSLDDIDTRTTSTQGVSTLLEQFLQVLSAASDIPAPRFLGQAPGGLNATGKGDLVNYYDGIKSQQTDRLKPQLDKLLPLLSLSAMGEILPIEIKFKPLYQLTESEQADLRTKDFTNITNALTMGLGDDRWAAQESVEREIFLNDPLENGLGSGFEERENLELQGVNDGCDYPIRKKEKR